MTRAATPAELAIYRSDGLAARLFAIVDQPVVVYQCQVNQVFATHDKVVQVTYDNAGGILADVLPGMTVLVGSTPGAWDNGLARVRKTWTADTAYIGEMSEIAWADDLYLTVIDEFSIWPRHLRVEANGTAWMDYDIAYSDQHSAFAPVPCLGPDRVLKLTGASVSTQFDASASWVIGSTISDYAWSVVRGAATLTNANTATPTLTATAAGRILVQCVVTAANGKTSTGYRNVYVYNANNPPVEIALEDFSGSVERGGFEFSLTLPTPPGFAPRDYCKVILFAEEQPQSIGPIAGAENVLSIGWLDASECQADDKNGTSTLNVKGAHYWLNKITGYPSGIENVNSAPDAWTEIQGLTVDKALWHLLYWRSTLSNCVDFFLTGDTRQATALQTSIGSLWTQIKTLAQDTILAAPVCDPWSRLFVEVDANYLPESERGSVPVVMTLTKDDYANVGVNLTRAPEISRVELSGIAVINGMGRAIFSLSHGHVFGRYGQPIQKDRLLLSNQAQANTLAGLILSNENKRYQFSVSLVSPARLVTLAPRQYLRIEIENNDTPEGIEYSGRILPRELWLTHDPETGTLSMELTCDPEIFPAPAVDGDIPPNDDSGKNWKPPEFLPPPLPPPLPPLPIVDQPPKYVLLLTNKGLFWTETFDRDSPVWIPLNDGFQEDDYTAGFFTLDMNQSGRYYVATEKRIYQGVVGYPAYLIADESYFDPILPPDYYGTPFPYFIMGLGCNTFGSDEIMVVAGNPYPISRTIVFTGSSYGLAEKRTLTFYSNGQGKLSWGRNGICFTYPHGVLYKGKLVRLSFDGSNELYITEFFHRVGAPIPHVRYWGLDKVVTIAYDTGLTKSIIFTNDGETSTILSVAIDGAIAYDESGLNWLLTYQNVAYKSTDGGMTHTQIPFPLSDTRNSVIWPVGGPRYVWAARGYRAFGDIPKILYTGNFGTSFSDRIGNLFDYTTDEVQFIALRAMV